MNLDVFMKTGLVLGCFGLALVGTGFVMKMNGMPQKAVRKVAIPALISGFIAIGCMICSMLITP